MSKNIFNVLFYFGFGFGAGFGFGSGSSQFSVLVSVQNLVTFFRFVSCSCKNISSGRSLNLIKATPFWPTIMNL
jgi:hypothetical protein